MAVVARRRARARVRSADAGVRRGADRRRTAADARPHSRLLRQSGVAARRAEPAAAARHRKGVSRKRGRADDDGARHRPRRGWQRIAVRATPRRANPVRGGRARCWCRNATPADGTAGSATSRSRSSTCCVTASSAGTSSSVAGEVVLPTGKESVGLGSGVTIFEPFVAFGQILPADGFLQVQAGLELPVRHRTRRPEAFWRAARRQDIHRGPLRPLVVADGRIARRARLRGRGARCSGTSCRRCRSRSTGGSTS